MGYPEFMNKIRYLDNITARWILRHVYMLFFQIILVLIFVLWFINTISLIDLNFQVSDTHIEQRILMTQTLNTALIAFLLLLNSFWLLFIFNGMQRLRNLLRDISYNTSKPRKNNI